MAQGLLGLSIGYELLRQGLNVKILSSNLDGESSNAAVGMLAPQIEFKSTEEKLFSLMLESKNLWNNFFIINSQKILVLIVSFNIMVL